MKKIALSLVLAVVGIASVSAAPSTRTMQINNSEVRSWTTTVQPGTNGLKSHRHDKDRIIVAFEDVKLKVVNNLGQSHIMSLKKNTPYFLTKDVANETHTDENLSKHPVKILVVELVKS